MAKAKKEMYVVVLNGSVDTIALIGSTANVTLGKDRKLMFNGAEVGEMAAMDVISWAMQSNSSTFSSNAPRADIRVSLSLIGAYGPKSVDVVVCSQIASIVSEEAKVQKKAITRTIIQLEFKGITSVNPGKVPLIEAIQEGKNPKVTFVRTEANEVELRFNGNAAGKTKLTEETHPIDWENLAPESIKAIKTENMKVFVDIEVTDEVKIDYSEIYKLGIAVGMTQEQVQRRVEIMADRYFMNKDEIEFIAKSWKPVKAEGLNYIPDINGVHYVDGKDRSLYYLLGYYAETPNKNLRLVGIQSTGKNTLIEQLASLLWKPLLQLSCSRETSREDFEGAVTLGHTVYKREQEELEQQLLSESFTAFQSASMKAKIMELSSENIVQTLEFLKEPLVVGALEGWWVLLDEINLASSAVTSRFHSLLDYRREITVPKLGTIKAVDGFAVVATMNPNSFVGASNMNQAFETRFRTITLDARTRIADILKTQCPKASKEEIKALDDLYDSIFVEVANEKLPDSFLSVRNFIDALSIKGFAPLKQRVLHNIAYISVNEPDANKIVEDIIDTLF